MRAPFVVGAAGLIAQLPRNGIGCCLLTSAHSSEDASLERAAAGHFIEGDAGGDTGIEALHGRGHRDRHDLVAGLADQPRQPLALGPDHDDQGLLGQLEIRQLHVAIHVETQNEEAGLAEVLQGSGQVAALGNRDASSRTGRGLPRGSGHAHRTSFRHHDSVPPEGGDRTKDRPEVAGVRDAVQSDDQRYAGRLRVDQVTGVGIGVRRNLESQTLVDSAVSEPVKPEAPGIPLIVALDGITDPRNLGAILRSVAAFGGHGVVVPERRSVGMTAAAWKTSAGAAARIPVAQCSNLTRTLEDFRKAGFFVLGLDMDGDVQLPDLELAKEPLVIVVGSEGKGLSRLVSQTCDQIVSIPMSSAVESLNAGIATGVTLYEVARRRAL